MQAMKRGGFWLFIGGVACMLLPILSVLLATGISSVTGCEVNEGFASACPILGVDISGLLYALFVSGWFALITIPISIPAVLVGLVVYAIAKVVLWRRGVSGV